MKIKRLTGYGKQIAKGSFTRCYKKENEDFVTLSSVCPSKLMLSEVGEHYDLYPTLQEIAPEIYRCEYFKKVDSLKKNLGDRDWKLYQTLRKYLNGSQGIYNIQDNLYRIEGKISDAHFEEIEYSVQDAANYLCEDACFEISPRNVAAKNGKLILLDVFFSARTLAEVQGRIYKPIYL